jgi:hypothetical protein
MSRGTSSSGYTRAPDEQLFLRSDGTPLWRGDISTLREVLSFAEELLKGKPKRGVHLYKLENDFGVTWFDGNEWMQRFFPLSSTTGDGQ